MNNNPNKFRIWSKKYQMFDNDPMWPDNQRTTEVFLLDRNGEIREFVTVDGENFFWDLSNNKKEDLILQKNTGLKDKNDKDIYEGDIVKIFNSGNCYNGKSDNDALFIAEWADIGFTFRLFNIKKMEYCGTIWLDDNGRTIIKPKIYEIIGNIFENPELLENK